MPKDAANPYADYDIDKLKAFLTDYELPRDPGSAYMVLHQNGQNLRAPRKAP